MSVRMNILGKHILSMGTEDPWLEALILDAGAEKITSLGNYVGRLILCGIWSKMLLIRIVILV